MRVQELVDLVEGKIVNQADLSETSICHGFASDLMSDVLTLDSENVLLITGLANLQVIRTAEMSDISCVIIARNKKVTPEMIDLATETNIVLIESANSVFYVAGKLYKAGISPIF